MDLPILSFFFWFFFLTFSNKLADDQAFYFFSISFCFVFFWTTSDHFYEQFYGKGGKKNKISHKKVLTSQDMTLTREGEKPHVM